jgi:PEP-CTERM motif
MLTFIPSDLTRTASGLLAAVALAALAVTHVQAAGVSGQGTWENTLQGRDLDGNAATFEAYYDTALNITWLADANYAKTSGYDTNGAMKWDEAKNWVSQLNINGNTGWRLPDVKPINGSSFNDVSSYTGRTDFGYNITSTQHEMSHLYYVTLGNKGIYDTRFNPQTDFGLKNSGPFNNIQTTFPTFYWSSVEYSQNGDPSYTRSFKFTDGEQFPVSKTFDSFSWAVHSGDIGVAVVPEPSTYALMGLGLAALALVRKRRHR